MENRLDKILHVTKYIKSDGCVRYVNDDIEINDPYIGKYVVGLLRDICNKYEEVLGVRFPKERLEHLKYISSFDEFSYEIRKYLVFFESIDSVDKSIKNIKEIKFTKEVYKKKIEEFLVLIKNPSIVFNINISEDTAIPYVKQLPSEIKKSVLRLKELDEGKVLLRLKFINPDIKLYLSETPFYRYYTKYYPDNVLEDLKEKGLSISQLELESYIRWKIISDFNLESDYLDLFTEIDKHLGDDIGHIKQVPYYEFKSERKQADLMVALYDYTDKINLFYWNTDEMSFIIDKSYGQGYYEDIVNLLLGLIKKVGLGDMIFGVDATTDIRKGVFLD